MRRILGIDPGSRYTGYGVIESDGHNSRHIASGRICIGDKPFSQRLGEIFEGVAGIIHDYAPVEAAVEQVFMARNASAALKLGQARGAAITAIVHVGLPVSEYTPRLVKQAIVGSGAADKSQVGHMVRVLLGIDQPLSEDQGDALAVALCHAHMAETSSRLAKGAGW
ncbi:MAG: crossover junction endodeoxyribonuclease RuvC [Chromatiales bacterium]|jgi:crossover junction endodeoxyribonuclease RuvC